MIPCYLLTFAHCVLGFACMWATLCRLNLMGKGTRHTVFFKYFSLGLLAMALMFAPSRWWVFAVLALILTKFVVTARSWNNEQPAKSLKI